MRNKIAAFYMEALLLVTILVAIILVLTGVFGATRAQSARAGRLTRAVTLAENAAEAVAASDSMETLEGLLAGDGELTRQGETLTLVSEDYRVEITWRPENGVAASTVTVRWQDEIIYTLDTAVYIGEAES